jgi:mannan endo-1,4-beta-mannosidase
VNEAEAPGPSGCTDENAAAQALRSFTAGMVATIRSVDPNHLISLGTIGSGQCGAAGDNYAKVNQPADICELHDYGAPTQAMPGDQWNGFARRLDQCGPAGLDQPSFVGEAGVPADVDPQGNRTGDISATTLQNRARFFQQKVDAQISRGLDGYLLWEHTTELSDSAYNLGPRGPYGVGPGDPVAEVLQSGGVS